MRLYSVEVKAQNISAQLRRTNKLRYSPLGSLSQMVKNQSQGY
ncbi:hypothetical protein LSH36_1111g00020 [Paralvinella palmiformis]|uniref:Uncharacterized protein n=1 Tax=Paralvinella palmiformis TaxID=53620 RepID=A0AAD9IW01_9ANNE|nr:hypothetical protein LSH36_1111g00020 [Paralvinella palmiformis]